MAGSVIGLQGTVLPADWLELTSLRGFMKVTVCDTCGRVCVCVRVFVCVVITIYGTEVLERILLKSCFLTEQRQGVLHLTMTY